MIACGTQLLFAERRSSINRVPLVPYEKTPGRGGIKADEQKKPLPGP